MPGVCVWIDGWIVQICSVVLLVVRGNLEALVTVLDQRRVDLTIRREAHHEKRLARGQFPLLIGMPRVPSFSVRACNFLHERMFGDRSEEHTSELQSLR